MSRCNKVLTCLPILSPKNLILVANVDFRDFIWALRMVKEGVNWARRAWCRLWDSREHVATPIIRLVGHDSLPITGIAMSRASRTLFSVGADATLCAWDRTTCRCTEVDCVAQLVV